MTPEAGARFGPYQILEQIGYGGMGVVFRARDTRLNREVALKIVSEKYIASGTPNVANHERFFREARSSSALSHPNICMIFDVGDQDGTPYLVMELLEGQTLKQVINGHPMPIEEVVEFGIQLAGALAEAHAKGILHRDIKPANLFVNRRPHRSPQLKVLDFGLAKQSVMDGDMSPTSDSIGAFSQTAVGVDLTSPGSAIGTIAYMSPEQARGEPLDGRADLFSAGTVLYEMCTGTPPFYGRSVADIAAALLTREPDAPRKRNPGIPRELERILLKSVAKEKDARYQTAADLKFDLEQLQIQNLSRTSSRSIPSVLSFPAVRRVRTSRGLIAALTAAVVLIAVSAAGWFWWSRHKHVSLTQTDSVILSDFTNETGDPVFDATLKQALAVQLGQSPFLNIMGEGRMRQALRYLGRSPDDAITPAIAREIGEREGIKAIITGNIAKIGNEYIVTLEAQNTSTGDIIARDQSQARSKNQVLAALHTAAAELRNRLGESLASIQKLDVPFGQATTTSLEAYRAYATGEIAHARSNDAGAVSSYKRAIELDPNFAMAYVRLGTALASIGANSEAAPYITKAFELSANVTERERLYIRSRYFGDVLGDLPHSIEALKLYGETYPGDAIVPNNLAVAYLAVGDAERAYPETLRAIQLDPNRGSSYLNAIDALIALNRPAEAKPLWEKAVALNVADDGSLRENWLIVNYLLGNRTEMERQLAWSRSQTDGYLITFQMAVFADLEGRMQAGQSRWHEAAQQSREQKLSDVEANYLANAAQDRALMGECKGVSAQVDQALKLDQGRLTEFPAGIALAFCGDAGRAQSLSGDLARRFPQDTLVNHVYIPAIEAAVALRRHKPADALTALDAAASYDSVGLGAYLRGLAHLTLQDVPAAVTDFEYPATHLSMMLAASAPGMPMTTPLSQLGLARAYALQDDKQHAREAYRALFTMWKSADPSLPILAAAHKEVSVL
jgi:eukaryotic-like serine/threonine-protein kinase